MEDPNNQACHQWAKADLKPGQCKAPPPAFFVDPTGIEQHVYKSDEGQTEDVRLETTARQRNVPPESMRNAVSEKVDNRKSDERNKIPYGITSWSDEGREVITYA